MSGQSVTIRRPGSYCCSTMKRYLFYPTGLPMAAARSVRREKPRNTEAGKNPFSLKIGVIPKSGIRDTAFFLERVRTERETIKFFSLHSDRTVVY